MATHFSILAGKFHGQRSLVGHSRKELDMTEKLSEHIHKHIHVSPAFLDFRPSQVSTER